jgi:hypothetical protein
VPLIDIQNECFVEGKIEDQAKEDYRQGDIDIPFFLG